jgi:hypothetical protein
VRGVRGEVAREAEAVAAGMLHEYLSWQRGREARVWPGLLARRLGVEGLTGPHLRLLAEAMARLGEVEDARGRRWVAAGREVRGHRVVVRWVRADGAGEGGGEAGGGGG